MKNCSVFINTCDKYSFIWNAWNFFYQKYWNKDIPWKVYFGTEEESVNFQNVINLKIGKLPWGEYVHKAMSMIPTDNVFFTMEDHFPIKRLDIDFLENVYNYFIDNDMDRLGLMDKHHYLHEPIKHIETDIGDFHKQTNKSGYLSCLQPSFWKKDFLYSIIKKDFTPYDGEISGTEIARKKEDVNIGYFLEEWYLEALVDGVPRDYNYDFENWKKLTTEHGWEGMANVEFTRRSNRDR